MNPALYGHAPHPALGPVSDIRDAWEMELVKAARAYSKPLLAICRGAQVLNVAFGGSLIQDLPSEHSSDINHDPDHPRTSRTHSVQVKAESRLGRAVGATELMVNSIHHQSIERVANNLRVVATAPDGVIEAVEAPAELGWWCVGVQWHPEELAGTADPGGRDVFEAFRAALG